MFLGEAYQPVARRLITPVSVGDAFGQVVRIADVEEVPTIGLHEIESLCGNGHGLEGQHEVDRVIRQRILLARRQHRC